MKAQSTTGSAGELCQQTVIDGSCKLNIPCLLLTHDKNSIFRRLNHVFWRIRNMPAH